MATIDGTVPETGLAKGTNSRMRNESEGKLAC